ncbi:winged helix-turn-helix transcriptional regulator [Dyadobacter sp. CY347]|uniref:winged helix-turn-helix transcriptional regulator n=1 Tax=Dyadobacter sp. CY347 TaxID=2909336 RepID=UPI0038D425D3
MEPNLIFAILEVVTRPSQLHHAIPQSTKRVLNLKLKELEELELIEKKIYHQLPLKIEYPLLKLS